MVRGRRHPVRRPVARQPDALRDRRQCRRWSPRGLLYQDRASRLLLPGGRGGLPGSRVLGFSSRARVRRPGFLHGFAPGFRQGFRASAARKVFDPDRRLHPKPRYRPDSSRRKLSDPDPCLRAAPSQAAAAPASRPARVPPQRACAVRHIPDVPVPAATGAAREHELA